MLHPGKLPARVDVVIVGAGSAGAAAALLCARRGMRALAIDRAKLDRAGAHWINAVPARHFEEAGIARPRGAELESSPLPYHLFAGDGPFRVVAASHDALEIDMARLVARLQQEALEAGAIVVGEARALGAEGRVLRTDRGDVRADAIVDASGLAGARLLPEARAPRGDLCVAAQEVRALRDRAAAEAFFRARGVPLGEALIFVGLAGGFSTLNVRLAGDRVSLLAGSIPALGHPSGVAMLARFAAEHAAWVGAPIRTGSRAIPLGRPVDVLARGPLASLGDSARMVFSAHGSGVGAGLVAARLLADELAAGRGPESYASRWMRAHGGLLAGADVFRRFSQFLTPGETERLMRAGLLDGERMSVALSQRPPVFSPRSLARGAPRAAREPRLVARIGRVFAKMVALEALYARYPRERRAQRIWAEAARRIAGGAPAGSPEVRASSGRPAGDPI